MNSRTSTSSSTMTITAMAGYRYYVLAEHHEASQALRLPGPFGLHFRAKNLRTGTVTGPIIASSVRNRTTPHGLFSSGDKGMGGRGKADLCSHRLLMFEFLGGNAH